MFPCRLSRNMYDRLVTNCFLVVSILSFSDRANEFETVVQYFRAHFLQVHRRNNENRRVLYTHLTSVVDTKATQAIIANGQYSSRFLCEIQLELKKKNLPEFVFHPFVSPRFDLQRLPPISCAGITNASQTSFFSFSAAILSWRRSPCRPPHPRIEYDLLAPLIYLCHIK